MNMVTLKLRVFNKEKELCPPDMYSPDSFYLTS